MEPTALRDSRDLPLSPQTDEARDHATFRFREGSRADARQCLWQLRTALCDATGTAKAERLSTRVTEANGEFEFVLRWAENMAGVTVRCRPLPGKYLLVWLDGSQTHAFRGVAFHAETWMDAQPDARSVRWYTAEEWKAGASGVSRLS